MCSPLGCGLLTDGWFVSIGRRFVALALSIGISASTSASKTTSLSTLKARGLCVVVDTTHTRDLFLIFLILNKLYSFSFLVT
jgi:hypothetical protein